MNQQTSFLPMAFLAGVGYLVYRSFLAPAGDGGNGAGGASGGASSDGQGAGGGSGASGGRTGGDNTTGEGGRGGNTTGGGAPATPTEADIMKAASNKSLTSSLPATFKLTADQWNYYRAKSLNADPVARDLWPAGKERSYLMTATEWHAQLAAAGLSGVGLSSNYHVTPGRRSQGGFF